ncbi:MAG: hypothetical protein FVQ83_03645 [Chloroflexi bacterium]|nr:hypothetical protein [Chloroflexota bacterium]
MSDLETLIEQFAGNPQVAAAKWFGKPCLNVNGKAFVVQFGGDLAFKLTAEAHSQALNLEGAKLFDPRGKGNAFKEWVQVPVSQATEWGQMAEMALDYVSKLS